MRQRSMSVFAAKGDDRLSKKFEGVASDNDAHFDSEDETKEEVLSDGWTKADYDSMVAQLKDMMKKDNRKWKTTLQTVNWEQIKIRHHTPQEVENEAKQLIGKVRTFRTLREILNDVPDVVNKILGTDRPKPPLTTYSLFVKEMLPRLREENKGLKVQDIFKMLPKLYQELSVKKRRRFEEASARLKKEYQANLSKFYLDHPEVIPKKARKEPLKTPFHLFYQSKRTASENLSYQQARKEWEQLPLKKKVKYIRASFEAQADTDSKLLNKKELELLDQDLGKPEYVGHNAYEFFRRKVRSNYSMSKGNQRENQIRLDYKKLDAQEQLKLKEEFQKARAAFVFQYQQYIQKLPKEKQQAEIDYLKTISDKTKKPKTEKNTQKTAMKHEVHSAASADEDLPVAESTTINKKKLSTGKKEKRKQPDSDEESEDSANQSSPKKQSKFSPDTSPPPPSTSKASALLSISKSEPTASSASSSDEEDDFKSTKVSTSRKSVPASPSKNGSTVKLSDSKKRTTVEVVKPEIEVKKPKKTQAKVTPNSKLETPPPLPSVIKATKTNESSTKELQEPEKPPKVVLEFYRQRLYKGKVGKHLESFENLSATKRREVSEQFKAAQKQYILDFEQYLKSLPKDEIRKYIQKVNAQKQAQSADDDSDDNDGDTEEGSSSEEEEEDD